MTHAYLRCSANPIANTPKLLQLMWPSRNVLSQSISELVNQSSRGTRRGAKLNQRFLPSAWKLKLNTRKLGTIYNVSPALARTSTAASCSYLNPMTVQLGPGQRFSSQGQIFTSLPIFSVLRYSLGHAPKLKWLICCGLTGGREGRVHSE